MITIIKIKLVTVIMVLTSNDIRMVIVKSRGNVIIQSQRCAQVS